jgi:hypothetical protein
MRFMCISYGQTLSIDIATTARRLIIRAWYQRHWGNRVELHAQSGRHCDRDADDRVVGKPDGLARRHVQRRRRFYPVGTK